jgi:hypothetical protein
VISHEKPPAVNAAGKATPWVTREIARHFGSFIRQRRCSGADFVGIGVRELRSGVNGGRSSIGSAADQRSASL